MFRVVRRLFRNQKGSKQQRIAALALLIGAGVALAASFVLSIEALILAKHPEAALHCDINAAVSCTAVANHWSSQLLGFPNAFIGLVTLPVMVTIGVALLAGATLPRWFMRGAQLGAIAGMLFAVWMLYMSIFEIQILCPWCLTTDIGMLLLFYGLTRYNVLAGVLSGSVLKKLVRGGYDTFLLVLCFVAVVVLILAQFNSQLLL